MPDLAATKPTAKFYVGIPETNPTDNGDRNGATTDAVHGGRKVSRSKFHRFKKALMRLCKGPAASKPPLTKIAVSSPTKAASKPPLTKEDVSSPTNFVRGPSGAFGGPPFNESYQSVSGEAAQAHAASETVPLIPPMSEDDEMGFGEPVDASGSEVLDYAKIGRSSVSAAAPIEPAHVGGAETGENVEPLYAQIDKSESGVVKRKTPTQILSESEKTAPPANDAGETRVSVQDLIKAIEARKSDGQALTTRTTPRPKPGQSLLARAQGPMPKPRSVFFTASELAEAGKPDFAAQAGARRGRAQG